MCITTPTVSDNRRSLNKNIIMAIQITYNGLCHEASMLNDVRDEIDGIVYDTKESRLILYYNSCAALHLSNDGHYFFHCIERGDEWIKPIDTESANTIIKDYYRN